MSSLRRIFMFSDVAYSRHRSTRPLRTRAPQQLPSRGERRKGILSRIGSHSTWCANRDEHAARFPRHQSLTCSGAGRFVSRNAIVLPALLHKHAWAVTPPILAGATRMISAYHVPMPVGFWRGTSLSMPRTLRRSWTPPSKCGCFLRVRHRRRRFAQSLPHLVCAGAYRHVPADHPLLHLPTGRHAKLRTGRVSRAAISSRAALPQPQPCGLHAAH